MNNQVLQRLSLLRKFMSEKSLGAYITFSTDPHAGEYVPAYWESRKWLSGFTGSAGTVVVGNEAGLWTDSRYFLQAEEQLSGTGIMLFKERLGDTPTVTEWLSDILSPGDKVGVDGFTVPFSVFQKMASDLKQHGIDLVLTEDPYCEIWKDRPCMSKAAPFVLEERFAGESFKSKISRIRENLVLNSADYIVVSSLDEIAWTLNMRGIDVHCNPLFLSYLLVSMDEVVLYINNDKLTNDVVDYLSVNGVKLSEYSEIINDLSLIKGKSIQVSSEINMALYESVAADNEVVVFPSPIENMKSIKNGVEISGIRDAMLRDGVAMVKFMKWLDESVSSGKLTEFSIDKKLLELRSEQKYFQGISFDTIAGYQEHGAIVHYSASEESALVLKPEGFLLLDSGAHYLDGTTDITRTIPLGPITDEQMEDYTILLKGFVQLSMSEFPHGTCGTQLDVLARMYMWKRGINYGHGTGHGVGHFLNVHEGPHQIRMNNVPAVLLPGMTVTNEPGIYKTGRYGIRTENVMLVAYSRETEFGKFYKFEQLTLCPISMKAVKKEMLSDEELNWLNSYHSKVLEKLSPYLSDDEKEWVVDCVSL